MEELSMTSIVKVNMRLCNFVAVVEATESEDLTYRMKVDSPCEKIQEFVKGLENLTLEDISDWPKSKVQRRMLEMKLGASCLVPSGIMNAARLEAGLISKSLFEEVKSLSIEFVS
jgi:hypothetical protein